MISWAPVWAIVLRHLRILRRNPNMFLFGIYWPILDVLVMGYLGIWIQQLRPFASNNYEVTMFVGILLWQVVGRGANSIITTFSEELWTHNIVNLFSLPICITEWITGAIIFYSIMVVVIAMSSLTVIALLYNVPLLYIISTFLLFLPPFFFSGIWLGFTGLQIIAGFGKKGVEFGHVIGWFLLPFSGAYYPIEILPYWIQKLCAFLPMSIVMQGMREYVTHQKNPMIYLLKSYVLSILYAFVAVVLFVYFFNKGKEKGLARLTD